MNPTEPSWLAKNWFTALQSLGIISSLLLAWFNVAKERKARRVSNYISLIKNHKDIWSTLLSKPELWRIRSTDSRLTGSKLTPDEGQFLTFVFLHITCSYEMQRNGQIVYIEQLRYDVSEFLHLPLVRRFWEESRRYYNDGFVSFIDGCLPSSAPVVAEESVAMKILVATAFPDKLAKVLATSSDNIVFWRQDEKIPAAYVSTENFDLVLCFGYGKILPEAIIKTTRCINMHGSLLPYGKGPNPNLASWINDEPHGVTILEMDAGVDTGQIICQKRIEFQAEKETLQSSFDAIIDEAADLLQQNWEAIRKGTYEARPQAGNGSLHTQKELKKVSDIVSENIDAPIPALLDKIQKRIPGFALVRPQKPLAEVRCLRLDQFRR